jgi:hypothetical protein
MIDDDKQKPALRAINAVLVLARSLAYDGNAAAVARVLDVAEYLPLLMLDSKDCTAQFRGHLLDLVKDDPRFDLALRRFDGEG